jgi:hypothetical protein
MALLFTWVLVSVVHFILQFIAWSYSSGNMATIAQTQTGLQGISWPILSFPIFWFIPQSVTTEFFWSTLVVNSIVWGGFISGLLMYIIGPQMKATNAR